MQGGWAPSEAGFASGRGRRWTRAAPSKSLATSSRSRSNLSSGPTQIGLACAQLESTGSNGRAPCETCSLCGDRRTDEKGHR